MKNITQYLLIIIFVLACLYVYRVSRKIETHYTDELHEEYRIVAEEQAALERDKITLQRSRVQARVSSVAFWQKTQQGVVLGLIILCMVSALCVLYIAQKRLLVHTLKIGDNTVPLRNKDLSKLNPQIVEGLLVAKQIEAQAPEKAFTLYKLLADTSANQLRAIAHAMPRHQHALQDGSIQQALTEGERPIPSFADLLNSGEIGSGQIVFGIREDGSLMKGTWEDMYSAAVAGVSGTGKSTTATSLILQSLLNDDVERVYIADPHRHKQEGLVNRLGSACKLPNVVYNDTNLEIKDTLKAYSQAMQRRINGKDKSTKPIILVIDELLVTIRNLPLAADIVKQIGTEGRGYGCYGLFLAQSWVGSDVGSTSVRDNLTSIFAHKLKKKQAQTLLQDTDLAKTCSTLRKDLGEVVFAPTSDLGSKIRVPICTRLDAESVYQMVANGPVIDIQTHDSNMCLNSETGKKKVNMCQAIDDVNNTQSTPVATNEDTLFLASEYVRQYSYAKLEKLSGVNRGTISKLLNGERPMNEEYESKLRAVLAHDNKMSTEIAGEQHDN